MTHTSASVLLNRLNCLRNSAQPWPVESVAEALRATQAMLAELLRFDEGAGI